MKDQQEKYQVMRILVKSNWNHTRKAVMLLDVFVVVLFTVGIIADNEFLTNTKVLLCAALFFVAGAAFLVGEYYIRTNKKRLKALPLYIVFWAVYEILCIVAAGEATSFFVLFLVSAVLGVSMAAFLIVSYLSTALFYTVQIFAFMGFALASGYGMEQLVYLVTIQAVCAGFALYRFCMETKHVNDRLTLESFIEESETDVLTGLLNRRGLARNLEAIWPYCQRENYKVSVLMLDIDYFKLYNDTFGHPQGDVCIQKIGSAILKSVRRRTDFAARIGGEEFLIFMPGMGREDAVEWADRLKNNIELLGIRHSHRSPFPNVTVSIGIMSYDTCKNITFEDMKREADECLYMAKNKGRNCICANGKFYAVPRQTRISG